MRTGTDDGLLEQLAACIALPSITPPGDAATVAAWIREWAKEFGTEVRLDEVWPGADNVLVTLDCGPGPTLVLNSHMDVVDPSAQAWSTPPFTATRVGDRVYGRGAADAKGSLVAMIAAIERVARSSRGLSGRVVLTAVVAEEAGGLGSLHLVANGLEADAAVVGEPTGLDVAYAHKGTYMRELTFRGVAAHSASPWLGRNAVADAAAFVVATETENRRLGAFAHPALGQGTMTVTTLAGGRLQNTVPDEATLIVDRRLVPGETHEQCDVELATILETLASRRPGLTVEPPRTVVGTVPSQTDPASVIVHAGLCAVERVRGLTRGPVGFNAGCDMSKLVGAGIPTIICGPGDLAQAHGPDEYVVVQDVIDAAAIYEDVIRDMVRPEGNRD